MIKEFHLSTPGKTAFIDITAQVEKVVKASSVKAGILTVFVPHTTAGVTINENADPSVRSDIIDGLDRIVPENVSYAHMEGNSPAHIKASLIGNSETILVKDGALFLGTWQGIYFCEFDGPRKRKVFLKVTKD
ncbi:MAG: YjbQ family protein [Candidatus Omnitrophica bacterium]|nr:YjbQ family protein [Candidatus Omnitrophota bacterium]